jgi:hypothetical protein
VPVLLGQWEALVAHCDHGETRIDTNLLEKAISPSAIGKKNFLFIGHLDAGDRSAIIYSIVVSCQRRGVDPLDYIRVVISRLPTMTTRDDLTTCFPPPGGPRCLEASRPVTIRVTLCDAARPDQRHAGRHSIGRIHASIATPGFILSILSRRRHARNEVPGRTHTVDAPSGRALLMLKKEARPLVKRVGL